MRRRVLPAFAIFALLAVGCSGVEPLTTKQALDRLAVASTKLYASNGSLIANLHGEINRDIVTIDEIPQSLQEAVVSIEDARFMQHGGLDARAITRAAVSNARNESSGVQGGSTLTQQLAKNLYFPAAGRTIDRKVAEARVTLDMERRYSKKRILEMYLNTIYLGRGAYGVQAASKTYFGKPVSDINVTQAAYLAGVVHEPAGYDIEDATSEEQKAQIAERAIARRNLVLDKMVENHHLSAEEAESAKAEPLDIQPKAPNNWNHPYFVDMVMRKLGVLGARNGKLDEKFNFLGLTTAERAKSVYSGGLRIDTTLDPKAQEAAEDAVASVLPANLDRLSASVVSVEPKTGYVRALVGGRDYYPQGCDPNAPEADQSHACRLAKVNLALGSEGGGSGRQPGSGFKPVVLATALGGGIGLGDVFDSSEFNVELPSGEWKVRNYEGSSGGSMSLLDGTANSVNGVYARLEVEGIGEGDALKGSAAVAKTARKLGITFPTVDELKQKCGDKYNQNGGCTAADSVPAIALGAKEVAPIEMAAAFATFAAEGLHAAPVAITKITAGNGKVLFEAKTQPERVLDADVARGVNYALRQVVERGTATAASLGTRPVAGKTGTSQQWRDAWFNGYVPQLETTVWVGNPIPAQKRDGTWEIESMVPSNGYPRKVVGGSYPAQIWKAMMSKVMADKPIEGFKAPPSKMLQALKTHKAPVGSPTTIIPVETPVVPEVPALTLFNRRNESGPGTVPNVVGMSPAAARNAVSRAGFSAGSTRQCPPGGASSMAVWQQSPGGGASAPRGSTVSIWYSPAVCN